MEDTTVSKSKKKQKKNQTPAPEAVVKPAAAPVSEDGEQVKPRKRKITKNIQLYVTICIAAAALVFLLGWRLFFNQSIIGTWNYTIDSTETPDSAATADEATAGQRVCYEFTEGGECRVTLGTMTAVGDYQLSSDKEEGNLVTISVFYNYSPILYGMYSYETTGNAFTGRTLLLNNVYYEEKLELESGEGEYPIAPFTDAKLDERLNGRWYDAENDIIYTFSSDGKMIRETGDGLTVEHYYTIMDEGTILARYASSNEENQTYLYEFNDGKLTIDGFDVTKMDQ